MSWNNATLREREKASIEGFVLNQAEKLTGRVLDFGCGLQPYRKIVENSGGDYHPFDRLGYPGCTVHTSVGNDWPLTQRVQWDAILCTQVIQYVPDPMKLIRDFWFALKPGGWLVLTGPTNWPEVEVEDFWRVTICGAAHMLEATGFSEIDVSSRECIRINDFGLSLGWGATGRAA